MNDLTSKYDSYFSLKSSQHEKSHSNKKSRRLNFLVENENERNKKKN